MSETVLYQSVEHKNNKKKDMSVLRPIQRTFTFSFYPAIITRFKGHIAQDRTTKRIKTEFINVQV